MYSSVNFKTRTPSVVVYIGHVPNSAGVFLSFLWFEGDALGKMELPAFFEGQVCLLGLRNNISVLQEFNGDIRRMEAAHVADQGVIFSILSWKVGVHLDFGIG